MTAKGFIENAIEQLQKSFKGIILEYHYDQDSKYHIIEVGPESIRRGNDEYKKKEMKLYIDFNNHFPFSNLIVQGKTNIS